MKLYHCAGARSVRPLWTLEEMGLEYELVEMEFPPRSRFPGYLDINPLGTVPTFVDGDVTLTESTGICLYLAEKYGPHEIAMSPTETGYGDYLNWLFRSDATLTFPQTLVLRYTRLEPEERRISQVAKDYTAWFYSRLRCVESALGDGRQYLVGGRFTIADIAVHYALYLGEMIGLGERYRDNTRRYFEQLLQRESFQRISAKAGRLGETS